MSTVNTEKILKEIRNRSENKKCMDCSATFPQYVVLDFGTWVCATCSGIHREFSHKVKSPTMSTFKPDELRILSEGGNDLARKKWRAKWSSSVFPEPDNSRPIDIRDFIKKTYEQKLWIETGREITSTFSKSSSQLENPPLRKSNTQIEFQNSRGMETTKKIQQEPKKKEISLIDFDFEIPQSKPIIPNNQPINTNNPFFSNSQSNQASVSSQSFFFNQPTALNSFADTIFPPIPQPFTPFQPATTQIDTSFPLSGQPNITNSTIQIKNNDFDPFDPFPIVPSNSTTPSVKSPFVDNSSTQITNTSPSKFSTIKPPPLRQGLSKNQSVGTLSRNEQNTTLISIQSDQVPAPCPICGKSLEKLNNAETNKHIDSCLVEQSKTSENEDNSWSILFNLSRMDWYFGDIDRKESEKILYQCSEDSFLVRKSSIKDSYAVSIYNHKKQTVSHTLIEPRPGGWGFQDSSAVYPTLVDLVKNSPECKGLGIPKKEATFF